MTNRFKSLTLEIWIQVWAPGHTVYFEQAPQETARLEQAGEGWLWYSSVPWPTTQTQDTE